MNGQSTDSLVDLPPSQDRSSAAEAALSPSTAQPWSFEGGSRELVRPGYRPGPFAQLVLKALVAMCSPFPPRLFAVTVHSFARIKRFVGFDFGLTIP